MITDKTQPREVDEAVNDAAKEPVDRKGLDLRRPCVGCGALMHKGVTDELRCLRDAVGRLNGALELYRGQGLCTWHGCRGKAMLCSTHAKAVTILPGGPRPTERG